MSDFETNEEDNSDHTNKKKKKKILLKELRNHIKINHMNLQRQEEKHMKR